MLRRKQEYPEARRLLEQAVSRELAVLKENPQNEESRTFLRKHYLNLAFTLLPMNEYEESVGAAREFLKVSPKGPAEYITAASVVVQCLSGKEREAANIPEAERWALLASWSEIASEYIQRAIDTQLLKCEKLPSFDLLSCNNVAWYLVTHPSLRFGKTRASVELAKMATQHRPGSGIFWNTLGIAHYRGGEWKESIQALEKSIELRSGGDSNDFFFLAMAHWQLGDRERAQQWYKRAVRWMEKNPSDDPDLRRFRAEAIALLGLPGDGSSSNSPAGQVVPMIRGTP
jgi:tetratricopeptide (TPR) repeat protein